MSEYKIITRHLFHKAAYGIWLFKENEMGTPTHNAKPSQIEFEPIDGGGAFSLPEPWLEMPHRDIQGIFQGLTDALVEHGFKPKTDITGAQVKLLTEFLEREKSNHDRNFQLLDRMLCRNDE